MTTRNPIDMPYPFFLLGEGYTKRLTSSLGETVFGTLTGSVNDLDRRGPESFKIHALETTSVTGEQSYFLSTFSAS